MARLAAFAALLALLSSCALRVEAPGERADATPPDAGSADAVAACRADWWDCGFSHRHRLRFDNAGQDQELVGFPVMIALDDGRIDYDSTADGGADLRFVTDEGMLLPHEVERWSPGGASIVWVRVPSIAAASDESGIWLYYGRPSVADLQDPAGVWDNGYAGVWHLNGDPAGEAPQQEDSTGHDNHGSVSGGMSADGRIQGRLGDALLFDGVDDWVEIPHTGALDITGDRITLSAWARMTAPQTSDAGLIIKSEGTQYNYQLGVQSEDIGNFRVRTDTAVTYLDGVSPLTAERWYHVTGVYDGAEARVYIDAALDAAEQNSGGILSTSEPLLIGRRALGDERFFDGAIDEVRVAATARSEAWIAAQYLSMTDGFVLYGQAERRDGAE